MKRIEEIRAVDPKQADDYDPEDLEQMRGVNLLPPAGRRVAWLVWELPWPGVLALFGGPLWLCFAWTVAWKISVLIAIVIVSVFAYVRRRIANPFTTYVMVTRRPVTEELT